MALVSSSCVKEVSVDPNEQVPVKMVGKPLDDGLLSIKASTDNTLKSASMTLAGDTVYTEKFLRTTYQAELSSPGLVIMTYQWTFAENNSKPTGSMVDFWHGLDPGSITSVTLIGIEQNGTAHTTTRPVKIVYSLDGMPGFILVSKTPVAGGMFSYVFAAHKKGMSGVKGAYGYTGTTISPNWTVMTIAPADTNFNYVGGALVAAASGDVGKYVAIRAILYPGEYEIHVGHIKDGVLSWGNFWSFYKEGKFTSTSTGDITGITTTGLPGVSGDEGINAVVRKDVLGLSVVIYTRHATTFAKGFIQLQYADGTWQTPIAETAVSGFPNWGKVEILYSSFPTPQILVFRFGPNTDVPGTMDAMSSSSYWDETFQVLRMKIVPVNG